VSAGREARLRELLAATVDALDSVRGAHVQYQQLTQSVDKVTEEARAALSDAATPAPFQPTHRHKKRGSTYQVIGTASVQSADFSCLGDESVATVYQDENGRLWVRAFDEFNDGRFEALAIGTQP